ncbi:tetratricopeptide repeat protein [Rubripirellula amarantea]|nr:tetratricopeptide repeat protein [Rubripirellula amarantea]
MSARNHSKNVTKQPTNSKSAEGNPSHGESPSAIHPALQKAWHLIHRGEYTAAANLLSSAGRDTQVRNALGVCLMRLGRVDPAVDVFRSFVLMPGTLIERVEVSNACKRNFATALLMKGFPSGALSVLAATRDPDHIMAVRLHSAISQWEKSLSWLRWLDWKLNGVEPSKCHIKLDFEPGEFDFSVELPNPAGPSKPRKASLKMAA